MEVDVEIFCDADGDTDFEDSGCFDFEDEMLNFERLIASARE